MNQEQLDKARRIAYLITGFIRNDLTPFERQELDEWIGECDDHTQLFGKLTDEKNIGEAKQWFEQLDQELAVSSFNQSIASRKIFSLKNLSPAWAVAASIVVIVVLLFTWRSKTGIAYVQQETITDTNRAILPGTKKAVLDTGNGKLVDLSQPENARIIFDDNNQATNSNSVLSYSENQASAVWHTLKIPEGGEYQLVLADGTKVWLNAESSIKYPTAFTGDKRAVELEGEAYFEVAHQPAHPFEVTCEGTIVKVIGTHFNIHSYSGSFQKISLLEGRINVEKKQITKQLRPGQEAVIEKTGQFTITQNSHIEKSIAWTKGKFSFDKTPLTEALQEIARWYAVDIQYKGINEQQFTGEIYRNSSIDEVLRMIRLSTGKKVDMHKRIITIRP